MTATTTRTGSAITPAVSAATSSGPETRRTGRGGSTSGRPVLGRARTVEVAASREVGPVDPLRHLGEVAIAQVGGRGRRLVAGREHVQRDPGWQRGQVADE